jgi:hypothetical protein
MNHGFDLLAVARRHLVTVGRDTPSVAPAPSAADDDADHIGKYAVVG